MVTIRRSINECLIGKTVVSKIPNRVSLMVVKLKSPQKSQRLTRAFKEDTNAVLGGCFPSVAAAAMMALGKWTPLKGGFEPIS